jgi:hypothetical protein
MKNDIKRNFPYKLNLQFFAEDPPRDPPADPPPNDPPADPPPNDPPKKIELTQEEFDAKIAERLARERKKYADYDEVKTKLTEHEKAEEERKKAEMSAQERLEAEKAEAEKKAQEAEEKASQALSKANERIIKSEFRLLAKELGVRSDALDDALVLSDLSAVDVDEDGNIKGVKEAVEALKESKSYLFGNDDYADASPGAGTPKRDSVENMKKKIEEAAEKARKSGRMEDKVAYAQLKKELGL